MSADNAKNAALTHGSWLVHNCIVHPIVGVVGALAHFASWLHDNTMQWNEQCSCEAIIEPGPIWQVVEHDNGAHIVPLNDVIVHELDDDCACGPLVDCSESTLMFTHHSLDGREQYEKKEA